jgi:hypothetical protein
MLVSEPPLTLLPPVVMRAIRGGDPNCDINLESKACSASECDNITQPNKCDGAAPPAQQVGCSYCDASGYIDTAVAGTTLHKDSEGDVPDGCGEIFSGICDWGLGRCNCLSFGTTLDCEQHYVFFNSDCIPPG